MDIRKIAVVGGFAVGAALTLAPLASADDLTTTLDSEIASLNSTFTGEADLAGVGSAVITNGPNTFDTIPLADAPDSGTPNTLDYELYGVNAIANSSPDPGAYDVLNGGAVYFDDAYNVALYALENNGALDTTAADFLGSSAHITTALDTGTVMGALDSFLTQGTNDFLGYLDLPAL